VKWQLVFTKQAQKDAKKLAAAGLRPKAEELLDILKENPFLCIVRYRCTSERFAAPDKANHGWDSVYRDELPKRRDSILWG